MSALNNDKGSVLVFITFMIVVLLALVGMGLDSGELVYTRSTGQTAVDAAALSAVTALPNAIATKNDAEVLSRAAAFVSKNNYTGSSKNQITGANVSYVDYDFVNSKINAYGVSLASANGVRVALEDATTMKTPAFLTPVMKLFGGTAPGSNNVSVSAVSVVSGRPSLPIAMWSSQCGVGGATKNDVQLKMQKPSGPTGGTENACWTTYLDNSSGGSDIKGLFDASKSCSGLPVGDIDVGISIYENKGSVTTVYDTADEFFRAYPGKCWLIPVITGTGNCDAKDPTPIVDWAKFCYDTYNKNGADSYVQGDVTCGQSINNTPDLLCYSNRLVREHKKGM